MRIPSWVWRSLAFLAISAVVLFYAVESKGFEDCIRTRDHETGKKEPGPFLVFVPRPLTCTVRVFDKHNGTLVALFTLTLWFTTQATLAHLRREFNAEHRPWISVANLAPADDMQFSDVQGSLLSVEFTIKNNGRTPALRMWPNGIIFPFFTKGTDDNDNLLADHQRLQNEAAKRAPKPNAIGMALAPEQTMKPKNVMRMSETDLAAYRKWYEKQTGECTLIVAGSVSYLSPLNKSEHHTGFIGEVWTHDMTHVVPNRVEHRALTITPSKFGTGQID